jgi:hypothetical protein
MGSQPTLRGDHERKSGERTDQKLGEADKAAQKYAGDGAEAPGSEQIGFSRKVRASLGE